MPSAPVLPSHRLVSDELSHLPPLPGYAHLSGEPNAHETPGPASPGPSEASEVNTPPRDPVQSPVVPTMTVGEVRRCLNQIRRAARTVRPEHLLFNGMTAGGFALRYVIGAGRVRKQRTARAAEVRSQARSTTETQNASSGTEGPPGAP